MMIIIEKKSLYVIKHTHMHTQKHTVQTDIDEQKNISKKELIIPHEMSRPMRFSIKQMMLIYYYIYS